MEKREDKIKFSSDSLLIEGLLKKNSIDRAVIITHPHPLYGGEMHNPVVSTIQKAFFDKGFTTLRFNFRGTGFSEGAHDEGVGEKNDLAASFNFLIDSGYSSITIAGYSFGAWVSLMEAATGSTKPESLYLISPPVGFIDFAHVENIGSLKYVITGDNDQFASYEEIIKMTALWNKKSAIKKIEGCDHFYSGRLEDLYNIIYDS